MGQSREEESIYKKHQELCAELNMDKDAADEAWQSYESIRQNYSLEVWKSNLNSTYGDYV